MERSKSILPKFNIKKIMKSAGDNVWIPDDTVELMIKMAEDYILDVTAKAIAVARNAGCKNRIRKKDLLTAVV